MSTARAFRFLALMAVAAIASAFIPDSSWGQTFQYPPYGALRGHMVARDGHHVQRYRWGNGVTPQGAAFLTTAVQAFAPVVATLVTGRGADEEAGRSDTARAAVRLDTVADYVEQQRRANVLLERTEALVSGPAKPTPAADPGRKALDDVLKNYGDSPWK